MTREARRNANVSFSPVADVAAHCDTQRMSLLGKAQTLPLSIVLASCTSINLPGSEAQQVLRIDEQRRIATLNADAPLLDRLIADDATLIYGDGTTETKASFLAQVRSGKLHWTKFEYDPARVRVYGDVAVVTGIGRSSINGGPEHTVYVTRVYTRQRGRWRLVASQTTRMKDSH